MTVSSKELMQGQKRLVALVLLVAVIAVYWPGLSGPFLFDDIHNFVENRDVHIEQWDLQAIRDAATAYGDRLPHRPVSTLSLALDHWMWDGEVFGFKVTNLLIHLVNTLLMLFLAMLVLRQVSERFGQAWPPWLPFLLAGLWAVHPLQVSTVLYVVQRMEMLAAMFILLSLLAYLKGRVALVAGQVHGWRWLALAGVFTILAVLGKETGVLAPLFMLAVELILFRFSSVSPAVSRSLRMGFAGILAFFVLVFLLWHVPNQFAPGAYAVRDFTWDERLLTQLRVLPMYLWWTVAPLPDQYLFYYDHFAQSESLFRPITTLLGGVFLLAFAGLGWFSRQRAPLVALGVAWFFVAHALSSNLVSLEMVFEHRNYLSIFGVLLVGAGLVRLIPAPSKQVNLMPACIALAAGVALISMIRAATWGDEMNLAVHHAHINPDSPRAGLDLAELYLEGADGSTDSPMFTFAHDEFERVAALPRASAIADQALILMSLRAGSEPSAEAWERLLEKVESRPLRPVDFDAIFSLIRHRTTDAGLDDDRLRAIHDLLLERDHVPVQIHVRFGYLAALVLDDHEMAKRAFGRARELLRDSPVELEALESALRDADVLNDS